MLDPTVLEFATIAAALFVVELTDKDALLILALATSQKPIRVFLAGSVAFFLTTTVIVTFGAALVTFVQVSWIRIAGGGVMLGYGLLVASRIARNRGMEENDPKVQQGGAVRRGFLGMVGSLALLDLAGDATEVLIIVLLAHYGNPILVFSAALSGLVAAVAFETALGSTLGRILTSKRLLYFSAGTFLLIGSYILATSL